MCIRDVLWRPVVVPLDPEALFTSPAAVTLVILRFLGAHIDEGDAWTCRFHWQGDGCGQSCGCCRAANEEDFASGREACQELWYFKTLNREARLRVRLYDGV